MGFASPRVNFGIYIYARLYVCMYVCMYTYIYMYIYIHCIQMYMYHILQVWTHVEAVDALRDPSFPTASTQIRGSTIHVGMEYWHLAE